MNEKNMIAIVVRNHVLEHLVSPFNIMKRLSKKIKNYAIIAAPNPIYLPDVVKSLFGNRKQCVNEGHLWCWNFDHLKNFFCLSTGGVIIDNTTESVTLPLPYGLRNILFKLGITPVIEFWLLQKIIPMFCQSLIVTVDFRKSKK